MILIALMIQISATLFLSWDVKLTNKQEPCLVPRLSTSYTWCLQTAWHHFLLSFSSARTLFLSLDFFRLHAYGNTLFVSRRHVLFGIRKLLLSSMPPASPAIQCRSTRNACQLLEDPKLAADMVKLAIVDALGFDVTTQTGGPDGSVLLEMDRYDTSYGTYSTDIRLR